jgi:hypothetical protein
MNRPAFSASGPAGPAGLLAACATMACLLLAACSNSPSSNSGNSGSPGSSSTPSSKTTTSSSTTSGGSTSVVSSDSEPFPIAVGNTWVYQSSIPLTGTTATVTNKVVSVTPASGGNSVTLSDNDSILPAKTTDETYIFHSDGSITYPSSQLGTSATIIKGSLVWPPASVISSGQSDSYAVEIALNNSTIHGTVTDNVTVKGDGTATVTEPAGTYSATVVQMTEKYKIEGYTETIVVKTWMASGVGPVQSEAVLTAAGHTEVVSELKLKSFTQG